MLGKLFNYEQVVLMSDFHTNISIPVTPLTSGLVQVKGVTFGLFLQAPNSMGLKTVPVEQNHHHLTENSHMWENSPTEFSKTD